MAKKELTKKQIANLACALKLYRNEERVSWRSLAWLSYVKRITLMNFAYGKEIPLLKDLEKIDKFLKQQKDYFKNNLLEYQAETIFLNLVAWKERNEKDPFTDQDNAIFYVFENIFYENPNLTRKHLAKKMKMTQKDFNNFLDKKVISEENRKKIGLLLAGVFDRTWINLI